MSAKFYFSYDIEYIRNNVDQVNWKLIVEKDKLSDEFIDEFHQYLDWLRISVYQKLSEDIMNRYASQLNWYCISTWQNLSEEFIKSHQNYVHSIDSNYMIYEISIFV